MNKKHFRLFILGFCAYASDVAEHEQNEIDAAYNVISGFVPQLGRFVSVQFTPSGTTTPATLATLTTPQHPIPG